MNKFQYIQPKSLSEASNLLKEKSPAAIPYAGGTDALDLIKHDILLPKYVINLKSLSNLDKINYKKGKELTIGALVKIADIVDSKDILNNYSIFHEAAKNIASPQLRNMGTVGGNICQRPRCWYFREDFNCLRKDGGECFAYLGENKYHCIIGGGPCYIIHPSDLAVALLALDSKVSIYSSNEERIIPLRDFFVLPEEDYLKENILKQDEIIREISIPELPSNSKSSYVKFTERGVWDFAVISVGGVLQIEGNTIKNARISFGGIAPIPWIDNNFNNRLKGLSITEKSIESAVQNLMKDAEPLDKNGYKVTLLEI